MPPGGLPEAYLEGGTDSLRQLVARFARGRGPFTTAEASDRFGVDVEQELRGLEREDRLVRGELRPGGPSASGATPTSSAGSAAPRSPRSAARSSRPSRPRSAASFRPGTGSTAARRCARPSSRCRDWRCPSRSGSRRCCRGASPIIGRSGSTRSPPAASSSGSGPGSTASRVFFREDAPVLGPAGSRGLAGGTCRRRDPRGPRQQRRVLLQELLLATGLEADVALPVLWELVWAGEVTNDAWAPLRAGRRYETPRADRRPRRFSRSRASGATLDPGPLVPHGATLRTSWLRATKS